MPLPDVMYRFRALDLVAAETGDDDSTIRMVASTSAPVGIRIQTQADKPAELWNEVLCHDEGAVDISGCKSLLLNHDPNQIIGSIRSIRFDGSSSHVTASVHPEAKLPTGIRVIDAVRSGALRGVSVGFKYRLEDCQVNRETRTILASKWRMLEDTLTPIPADTGASVRSFSDFPKELIMPDPVAPVVPAVVPAIVPDPVAGRADFKAISLRAEGLKLRASDYADLSLAAANAKMLDDLATRDAAGGGTPGAKVRSHIVVGTDAIEKTAQAAEGALLWNAGFRFTKDEAGRHEFSDGSKLKDIQENNPLRGRTILDLARGVIDMNGGRAGGLNKHDLAAIVCGRQPESYGARDAANTTTGYFSSFVFANVIKKAVSVGFSASEESIIYRDICGFMQVPDYKPFKIGSLGVGFLQSTPENEAFPELDKAEGVYNAQIGMWGGTISLSEQAIVSDDLGLFMQNLQQAGLIAQKTINKRVIQKLLLGPDGAAAWTSNTTTGTIVYTTNDLAVVARNNIGKVDAALMGKIGLDGGPTGNSAAIILVPSTLGVPTAGLMSVAPGQQNTASISKRVIATPWLEYAGLTGFSATSYYMIANPNMATGLVLATIQGIDSPRVEQYDPGAVAASKWKIYMPFTAELAAHTVGSTSTVAGIQRGTV